MKTMKTIKIILLSFLVAFSSFSFAGNIRISNLKIKMIRAVGDYEGRTYDNTIELWFTTPISWPSSECTDTRRVYVDAKHQHIVSAAYTAFISGKKVSINVDTALAKRTGACEVSYLDIIE